MGLTTAERNRRKRERKKREREERRKAEEREAKERLLLLSHDPAEKEGTSSSSPPPRGDEESSAPEVEVEYVSEPLPLFLLAPASSSSSSSDVGGGGSGDAAPAAADGGGVGGGRGGSRDGDGNDDGGGMEEVLRRFHERSSVTVVVTDDDDEADAAAAPSPDDETRPTTEGGTENENDSEGATTKGPSKRQLRERNRPTVAELKRRVDRADLVEAHDVTASDPDFLIYLKGVPGTVPVPRHWGRKRKYLQGKRGIEKAPFRLPDFIVKTGICDIRNAVTEDESKQSLKQKSRSRVAPKMGTIDVDYRTLHDAFFKHQTRPINLTKAGDLYYEGKEFETQRSEDVRVGRLSERLREALGMTEGAPPPWLVNMQRYGPPPSYPNLKIPGLNAPIPGGCSYGYHLNGWGKPPVDAFGRPLYGGDPFGKPIPEGGEPEDDDGGGDGAFFDPVSGRMGPGAGGGGLVTSDGKPIKKKPWGALPTVEDEVEEEEAESSEEEEEEESGSDEEMAESEEEEDEGGAAEGGGEGKKPTGAAAAAVAVGGTESVLPEGAESVVPPASGLDLRKQPGTETPMVASAAASSAAAVGDAAAAEPPKRLYTVLEQTKADREKQAGAVFSSDVAYVLPGAEAAPPEGGEVGGGAESVLSKALPKDESGKRKRSRFDRGGGEEDEGGGGGGGASDELGKKFKF